MSNIFKSNSRFAGLSDDIPANKDKKNDKRDKKKDRNENQNKDIDIKDELNKDNNQSDKFNSFKDDRSDNKFNSFKDERPNDGFNSFKNSGNSGFRDRRRYDDRDTQRYREQREAEEKTRREFEEKEKERLKQESLKIENFPDLVIKTKKELQQPSMNFVEIIKKEEEKDSNLTDKDNDLENLKEGWILFKHDPITRKSITKRHPNDILREIEEKQNSVKSQQEIINENMNEIIKALSELHERRTNEYIELYGYDTWEKMFKFPGWQEWEAEFDDMDDSEDDYYENEEENTF